MHSERGSKCNSGTPLQTRLLASRRSAKSRRVCFGLKVRCGTAGCVASPLLLLLLLQSCASMSVHLTLHLPLATCRTALSLPASSTASDRLRTCGCVWLGKPHKRFECHLCFPVWGQCLTKRVMLTDSISLFSLSPFTHLSPPPLSFL